jgi:hypothetical protein
MIVGMVLDSFSISMGKVFVIKFDDVEYRPSMGGKLFYAGTLFKIKPYSLGKHDYYKEGFLYATNVWSCILESLDSNVVEANIPNGSDISVDF